MNVKDANNVVSRYSPTTQSTDNELRVIGNESLKMHSDYLRGAIPLCSLPPWRFCKEHLNFEDSIKHLTLIRFAVCWVNKLGLSSSAFLKGCVWQEDRAVQTPMMMPLPSWSSCEGQDIVVEDWFCSMVHKPKMAYSLPGACHIPVSACTQSHSQNEMWMLSVRAALGSWVFVLSVVTQKIDHVCWVYRFTGIYRDNLAFICSLSVSCLPPRRAYLSPFLCVWLLLSPSQLQVHQAEAW